MESFHQQPRQAADSIWAAHQTAGAESTIRARFVFRQPSSAICISDTSRFHGPHFAHKQVATQAGCGWLETYPDRHRGRLHVCLSRQECGRPGRSSLTVVRLKVNDRLLCLDQNAPMLSLGQIQRELKAILDFDISTQNLDPKAGARARWRWGGCAGLAGLGRVWAR